MPAPIKLLRQAPKPFGDLLAAHLEALGMSQHSFARVVGLRVPNVNQVVRGHRGPPLKHLERWLTVLKLEGEAAAEFRVAAWLANAPEELGEYVARLHRAAK